MSIHELFTPSTWRLLGLSVGLSYIGLGTTGLTFQSFSARVFGLLPPRTASTNKDSSPYNPPNIVISQTYPVQTSLLLLGARDLSIGIALLNFWNQGKDAEMGTLILSGMVLCVADVYVVGKLRTWGDGGLLGVGAAIWGVIGLGLVGC